MISPESYRLLCYFLAANLNGVDPGEEDVVRKREIDWQGLVRAASETFLLPALYCALRDSCFLPCAPKDVQDFLSEVYALNVERTRIVIGTLHKVSSTLGCLQRRPVFLKGASNLNTGVYSDPAALIVGDIDVLVDKAEIDDAVSELKNAGWTKAPCDENFYVDHHHVAPLVHHESPVSLELHHGIVMSPSHRAVLPAEAIFRDAVLVQTPSQALHVPSIHHHVTHTVFEAAFMHPGLAHLRKLYGFVRMASFWKDEIDWPAVIGYFKKTGQYDVCLDYLLSGSFLFGWKIPDAFSVNHYEKAFWMSPIDIQYRNELGVEGDIARAKLNEAREELRLVHESLSKSNANAVACGVSLESTREDLAATRQAVSDAMREMGTLREAFAASREERVLAKRESERRAIESARSRVVAEEATARLDTALEACAVFMRSGTATLVLFHNAFSFLRGLSRQGTRPYILLEGIRWRLGNMIALSAVERRQVVRSMNWRWMRKKIAGVVRIILSQ